MTFWQKLATWWNNLPHGLQAVVVAFGGGAFGIIEKALQDWATGVNICSGPIGPCLEGYGINALKAGIVAVSALYIRSSFPFKGTGLPTEDVSK